MAQISYGTITITDTTDINKIENWYLATDLSSGVTRSNPASGHGTWTTSVQSMTSSFQYLWNYEKIYGTGLNNADVLISQTDPIIIGRYGQNGTDGTNGTNGVDGNSILSIDEYYQVTNSTTNPGSSGWQKNTLVTPTNDNKYLWNYQVINYSKTAAEGSYTDARIIGVYGDPGPQGPQGNPGTNGINTATVYLYQRAASAPSKPSGTLTYTFSSASITSGTLGNWKQSIGELSGTNPIWVIAAVASSNGTTDTIASSEWSTQIKLAQNGTDGQPGGQGAAGLNQATVFIYKRATSVTTPSATTYTFSNGSFTVPSGWSKTIPASDGNPCYVTSAVAIGNGTTATLTWNTPSVLVEDGTDGISPTVTSTDNGVKIVDADGNETYITNGASGQSYYTYVRYSANSNGSGMVTTPTSSTKYIGIYSGTSSTVPAYTAFTWSKYVGDPGQPATQYYAFVKYATDANGSNMQDSPDSTHIYVGTYTGTSSSPAASAYQWSKYVGDPGQPATQYYAFIRYATSSTGANMTDTPTASTTYVGTYAGTKSSPTASDYKWSVYVGTNGVSVTQTRELYYLKTNSTNPSQITASSQITATDRQNGWTSIVPTYVANAEYWTCIETSLSSGGPVWSTPVLNNALTDESYRAWEALSISQNANENAQGAMAQAAEAQYQTEALDAKLKQFFWPGDSNYPGAYAVSGITGTPLDPESISTYGFNVAIKPASVTIGYNTYKALELDGGTPALKLYKPSKTAQGALNMTLSNTGLTFYDGSATNGGNIQAQFGSSGAIQSGDYAISAATNKFSTYGTKIDLVHGEIYSPYFRLSQGSVSGGPVAGIYMSGTFESTGAIIGYQKISNSDTNAYWKIGYMTDTNQDKLTYQRADNNGFIELAPSSTFIIQKNKIHTGWFGNNGYLTYPQLNSKYYDFGMNLPTSLTDKFLYIRYNSGSNLSTIYQNDSGWTYPFSVDAEGKVRAQNFYIGNSDTPIGGGTGTVAERLTQGYGSTSQPIYFNDNGVPTNTTYTLNAAGAKGVDTSMPTTATDSNVPTTKLMKTFVEGKGYITGYTETDPTVPNWAKQSTKPSYALSEITNADDIKAIEALTGTKGFLKKTATNTWSLDTNTYLTSYTETDPIFTSSAAYGITSSDITNWNGKTSNTGTVTKVSAGVGLAGGDITSTGTLKAKLRSETKLTNDSVAATETSGRIYPIVLDKSGYLAVNVPWTNVNSNYLTSNSTLNWNKVTSNRPTTLSGYGITDAKIANGVVTLGSNTISSMPNPNALTIKVYNANTATAQGSTYSPTEISYDGSASGKIASVAGTNAITKISATEASGGSSTFTVVKADGSSSTFNVNISGAIVSGATILTNSSGVGLDVEGPVYFDTGVPKTMKPNTSTGLFLKDDGTWAAPVGTTYTFDGTYNASSNKAATVSTVTNAINALDGGTIGTPSASKTITAISQTNGNISVTFGNISITKSQISDFPTSMAPTAHTHDDRYYTETEIDNRFKKYIPFSHYSNTDGNNSGKYYKISINSYTGWMLNFTVKMYHAYKAFDLQISGYNYGSSHWYSPAAVILGASVTNTVEVNFGYDSDYHLWIAIPAEQYTGIGVTGFTNGYQQISDWEDLFTITMVDGLPSTKQSTVTAYRPWYRNETVSNATSATSAGKWTTARNFTIKDSDSTNSGTAASVDGSAAVTLLLPSTIKASLTGNASTATKWASAQTVYVTLGTASTSTTIQGGSSSAQTIGVNGTLAIGNGGTGLTSSPSMLVNLGSTTAANVLQASPRPGITGTLGVGNGGTGVTTLTSGAALIGNGAGAIQTRSITNLTTSGTVTASTNLITANSLVNHVATITGNYVAKSGDTMTGTLTTPELIATKIKADDVNVTHLLTAEGIQTKNWTAVNIATIDGSFYIVPTISIVTAGGSKFNYTSTGTIELTAVSPNIFGTNSLFISGDATNWTVNSLIMITGAIEINGEYIPIGTIKGTLSAITTATGGASKLTLSNPTTSVGGTPNILSLVTKGTQYNCKDLKVSIYSYRNGSQNNLLGIMMTTAGTKNRTYIDIYDGTHQTNAATDYYDSNTTYTEPVVRIGNLRGLPAMTNGEIPNGWGIYTTNGYFKGKISAESGHIGANATNKIVISDNNSNAAIYSGSHSTLASTNTGFYIGADGISIGAKFKYTGGTTNTLTVDSITATNFSFSSGSISGSVTIGTGGSSITNSLAAKAAVNAEYSVDIVTSNFNPTATSGTLVTLTAKVTRVDGGSISGIKYQWFGDSTSLGSASTTATSYNVPWNTTYKTFTVEIS